MKKAIKRFNDPSLRRDGQVKRDIEVLKSILHESKNINIDNISRYVNAISLIIGSRAFSSTRWFTQSDSVLDAVSGEHSARHIVRVGRYAKEWGTEDFQRVSDVTKRYGIKICNEALFYGFSLDDLARVARCVKITENTLESIFDSRLEYGDYIELLEGGIAHDRIILIREEVISRGIDEDSREIAKTIKSLNATALNTALMDGIL